MANFIKLNKSEITFVPENSYITAKNTNLSLCLNEALDEYLEDILTGEITINGKTYWLYPGAQHETLWVKLTPELLVKMVKEELAHYKSDIEAKDKAEIKEGYVRFLRNCLKQIKAIEV